MSISSPVATVSAKPAIRVRPLKESRPPAMGWRPPDTGLISPDQPPLGLTEPPEADLTRPNGRAASSTVVRARWTARPRRGLPDACEWGAALALAVFQALLAQRPIAQLNRWLADDVLSAVSVQQRRRRTEPGRAAVRPVVVRSVRVQHPSADVAEVSVHLVVGTTHTAVALRLEAVANRWLCTAFELDLRALR